ncbi:MAG: rhodanese-like domain-containing protein [Nitrospirae bacterium]|nr:rhodanese-like domain-containing protein [Nitrospirota bacterium]
MVRDITTADFLNMLNSEDEFIPLDVASSRAREDVVIRKAVRCLVEDIDKWAVEHFDNRDEKIVIFCGGNICGSLYEAARLLDDKGFVNVFKYEGSLDELFDAGSAMFKSGVWT